MRFRILCIGGLVVAFAFGAVLWAYAQQDDGRKVVASDQTIEGDYVAAGDTVEIAGVVKGDAYVAGAQVLVNGTVEGDLLAAGGTVSISGNVGQNVRAAGWQVIVSGDVGRNVTVGGMNVEITREANLQGSIIAGAGNVVINGPVAKSVKIAGRNLTIANRVAGDVEAAVDIIRLASGATLQGNFTYWSNRAASIEEGVQIQGTVTKKAGQGLGGYVEQFTGVITSFARPFLGVASFLSSLLLGILLIKLFPNFTRQTILTLREQKWKSLSSGIASLLIIPIVFGVLILSIVGIPLGVVLLAVSSLVLYIARIFVMLFIGMVVSEKLHKNISDIWAFGIGLGIYTVLVQVPYIGWIVPTVAVVLGLGAAVQAFRQRYISNKDQAFG